MAEIVGKPKLDMDILLRLNEQEAKALHALTVYGSKSFLEAFYKTLGKAYLEPHEVGLVTLFDSIQRNMPTELKKIDDARKVFDGTHEAIKKD